MLLNRLYAWRGYGNNHVIPATPSHTTFTAMEDETVVGTLTLSVDTGSGLALDTLFKDEIDHFRKRGSKVCELTKFACQTEVPSNPFLHRCSISYSSTANVNSTARICSLKSILGTLASIRLCWGSPH